MGPARVLIASLLLACAAAPSRAGDEDPFEAWLSAPIPPADGFVAPLEKGWARAPARGRIVEAGDGRVVVEHLFYENHRRRRVQVALAPLLHIEVAPGAAVERGAPLGRATAATTARFVLVEGGEGIQEADLEPARFVSRRKELFVPQDEPVLLLVHHESYSMVLVERGAVRERVAVSFGQAPGQKEVQGDLKTPKGMYFVVARSKGPFTGPIGPYYGGHWIKISYPNAWDAERGVAKGLLTRRKADEISRAWAARRLPWQGSRLGGGIGLHGWIEEWSDDGPRHLSWGCVVLHNRDVSRLYERIPLGAMVVLF